MDPGTAQDSLKMHGVFAYPHIRRERSIPPQAMQIIKPSVGASLSRKVPFFLDKFWGQEGAQDRYLYPIVSRGHKGKHFTARRSASASSANVANNCLTLGGLAEPPNSIPRVGRPVLDTITSSDVAPRAVSRKRGDTVGYFVTRPNILIP